MYGYQNEAGEPIMDGSAYRHEQYIDSMYEPDPDEYYSRWDDDGEPSDPEHCSHGDGSFPEDAGFDCDGCDRTYLGPRTEPYGDPWVSWDEFFVKR